jgi:hypothetical protein
MHNFFGELSFSSAEEEAYFERMVPGIIKLMNGVFLPYADKSRILSEIRQKYNVDFSLSVFDEGEFVYPKTKYDEENEIYVPGSYEYIGLFCINSYNKVHSFECIEDVAFNGYHLGLIIQAFFRKFRHDGFFSATFGGGVLIVTAENVKIISYEEIIDEQRKLHETLFKRR